MVPCVVKPVKHGDVNEFNNEVINTVSNVIWQRHAVSGASTWQPTELKALSDPPQPCKGSVPMQGHPQQGPGVPLGTVLMATHASQEHRGDGLQVGGVWQEPHVHMATQATLCWGHGCGGAHKAYANAAK